MKTTVVIPTYNEAENLPNIVGELLSLGIDGLQILIVDDNSPDGTGKLAEGLAKKDQRIKVICRMNKLGLGSAYI